MRSRGYGGLILAAALICLAAIATAGCDGAAKQQTKVVKRQTIRITGSSTCLPLLKILTAEYSRIHPDVKFLYLPGAHSGAGIQGAVDGTLDIGAVSRDLKPEEAALGLEYVLLSNDGLVLATHKNEKIANITSGQVKKIYSGETVSWKDLGGQDKPIVVLDRAEDESAKIILREYVLGDIAVTPNASVMFLETDIIQALETTPDTIGYLSRGAVTSDDLDLNVLNLDGVEPSVKNIKSGKYKMVRPLGVVLKKNPSAAAQAFVDWATGGDGTKTMDAKGYASAE